MLGATRPLTSQFRATYTTLLNLLDAYGNFAQVRDCREEFCAPRSSFTDHPTGKLLGEAKQRIKLKLRAAGCDLPLSVVIGFERLVSARTRLQELRPHTRADAVHRWLDEVVQPGRVVGIGRSGRRLVLITEKRAGNVRGIREDGRSASFALERIGRVYEPIYRQREEFIEEAFADVRQRGRELLIPEPRLPDAQGEEGDAISALDDRLESVLPAGLAAEDKLRCTEALWTVFTDAEEVERATRRIEQLRAEVWEPFHRRARVLAAFGYLDFDAEKITERGRWLADLHVDRPLLVGEALEAGLFNSLEFHRLAGVMAALTADEDRDYGQLELDDSLINALVQFEETGFKVATQEWKLGIEPAPELNFSAAAAAARWATGAEWPELVHETGAEEGDLFRMLSRTGEALLQVAGLRRAHAEAARAAAVAADAVLREPVR